MNTDGIAPSVRAAARSQQTAKRRRSVGRDWLCVLGLVALCPAALAQVMYRITPLGYLGGCKTRPPTAAGYNGHGQVAGTACTTHGDTHAFVWKNDGTAMVDLGPSTIPSFSEAVAIDSRGLVTGDAQVGASQYAFLSAGDGTQTKITDGIGGSAVFPYDMNNRTMFTGAAFTAGDSATHAFLWQAGGAAMTDLGTLGGTDSSGESINDSMQIAGSSDTSSGSTHAFLWRPDGTDMQDLGTLGGNFSDGLYINAAGDVAGTSNLVGNARGHAFYRGANGPMQDLGTLGGAYSHPTGLNNSGQVTGNSFKSGPRTTHAFVWLNDGTPMRDLGTFGGTRSFANNINLSGQVTGGANLPGDAIAHAFLWRNDGTSIQDLNKLIDPTDPLRPFITLTAGERLNFSGDVVAEGTDSRTGRQDLYVLHGTVFTLNPRSLVFGSLPIHTTSAPKSVTLTNDGDKFAAITGTALGGADASQFAASNSCGKGLNGKASCTIQVTFKPTTKGSKSAILNLNGGNGGLTSVNLSGTAT